MSGFVFFDTETTGLRKGFDQIVQFAALRTDANLEVVDRFEIRSRLQRHVVPHPRALLTNGLSIDELLNDPRRKSHYQMVAEIHRKLMEWSPAIFVGYNSIGFDEEMLRHSFFQNLFDPYLTSRPGCGRADALSLVLRAHACSSDAIVVPRRADGRRSFRLADVAVANGLNLLAAHEATSDVRVTLELCRRIRSSANEAWQGFTRFSTKAAVAQFIETEQVFFLSEFFGEDAYHRPVCVIGKVPDNANGRFCFDLTLDPSDLARLSDEALVDLLCKKGSPVRRLAINGCPALTETWQVSHDIVDCYDIEVVERRASILAEDPSLCARMIAAYTGKWRVRERSPFPEHRLHDGFAGEADKARMQSFHQATPERRRQIVERFEDDRLAAFGRRLVHAEHRPLFDKAENIVRDLEAADRLIQEHSDGPLTLARALVELDLLLAEGQAEGVRLLGDYRLWLLEKIDAVENFRRLHSVGYTPA